MKLSKPKTGAQRQKEYRAKIKAMQTPEKIKELFIRAYMEGFNDAVQGKEPMKIKNAHLALHYMIGGLDAFLSRDVIIAPAKD